MARWGAALAHPVKPAAGFPGVQPAAVITPPYATFLCLEEIRQKKTPNLTQELLKMKNVNFVQIYHPTSVNPQNLKHVLISQGHFSLSTSVLKREIVSSFSVSMLLLKGWSNYKEVFARCKCHQQGKWESHPRTNSNWLLWIDVNYWGYSQNIL